MPAVESSFWHLIESFDWSKTGDDEAVIEPAVSAVAALPVDEIEAFVASTAYERKTGNEFEFTPRISYETFANAAGWRE